MYLNEFNKFTRNYNYYDRSTLLAQKIKLPIIEQVFDISEHEEIELTQNTDRETTDAVFHNLQLIEEDQHDNWKIFCAILKQNIDWRRMRDTLYMPVDYYS